MVIQKGESVYTVTESTENWTVRNENGKVFVSYDVSKALCPTFEELKQYIQSSELF